MLMRAFGVKNPLAPAETEMDSPSCKSLLGDTLRAGGASLAAVDLDVQIIARQPAAHVMQPIRPHLLCSISAGLITNAFLISR
jgi:hypothetical protein